MDTDANLLEPGLLATTIRQHMLRSLTVPGADSNPYLANFESVLREYPSRVGKTWRGLLTCWVSQIHGGQVGRAIPFAAALELFQNWIIVHDDVEDYSDERRGKPTLHKLEGVPIAVNAGDAMHAYMWESLLRSDHTQEILEEFARVVSTTTQGQHIEMSWIRSDNWEISQDDYIEMARKKGAYYTMVAPLRLGALIAGDSPPERYLDIGLDLGVAYQLRDDVLNLVGNFQDYGKEVAGDLWEGKRTLILLDFLRSAPGDVAEHARSMARKPRAEKTAEEVDWLLSALRESQSIEYAQRLAENIVRERVSELLDLWRDSNNPSATELCMSVLTSIASRSS